MFICAKYTHIPISIMYNGYILKGFQGFILKMDNIQVFFFNEIIKFKGFKGFSGMYVNPECVTCRESEVGMILQEHRHNLVHVELAVEINATVQHRHISVKIMKKSALDQLYTSACLRACIHVYP